MTHQRDFTLPSELLEQIASQGFDFVPDLPDQINHLIAQRHIVYCSVF